MRVANEVDIGARSQRAPHAARVQSGGTQRPSPAGAVALSARQQADEARAFQRTVAPYRAGLRASALRLTQNRSDADDLLQDTLLRAWRYWPRYREQANCRAWLQRIMLNTFCSERRSRARHRTLLTRFALVQHAAADAACTEENASRQARAMLSREELANSLSALKPEQARILRLVDVDERSYREAAAELACPVGTVMSRLHRARLALRSMLAAQVEACA